MSSLAASEPAVPPRLGTSALGARVLAFAQRGHAQACALLFLISLACFLPGFVSLQPMDRDEPRFAQATKQMLETGDFVDIRFQDEARHKKPVGIHWMQSASVAAAEALGVPEARIRIAVYRVPSLLGALATVLLTYWAALAFLERRGAFLAAGLVAGSVILMVEARLAKTDAMLAATCVAAMGGLARAYFARGVNRLPGSTVAVFWAAMALGLLVKGPMILLFTGLPALVLSMRERSGRWLLPLRPGLGAVVVFGAVAPWFIAIAVKSGGAYYAAAVGDDLLGKVSTGQQKHWGPPGYYFIAFFATFWPGAALAAIAAPFAWTHRREEGMAFALAWIVPAWLVFEAISTKLPHYVLPLYPAIAIATVAAIARGYVGPHRPGATLAAGLIVLTPAGLALGLLFAAQTLDGAVPYAALPVLAAAALVAALACRAFAQGEVEGAALTGVGAAMLLAVGVLGLAQPVFQSLKVSPRLAEVARGLDCPDPALGTVGYREPSLVLLTRTDLQMFENGRDAAAFLKARPCAMLFVEARHRQAFRAEAERLSLQPALAATVRGFNINGGRRTEVEAYAVRP
ncbi:MAG TPA: glycosyltransferase family 39 protein [Beijerinckiaceae bacterium]|jgi:4-amino-4-deoxy-L-arabinose transferase-like glycosyltransferase